MRQKVLKGVLLLMAATTTMLAKAQSMEYDYDCEIDSVWYNLDEENMTAEVTYHDKWTFMDCLYPDWAVAGVDYGVTYKGDVVIPAGIDYEGKRYTVTAIGPFAFASSYRMTSLTLPHTITDIAEAALELPEATLMLTCHGATPPSCEKWAFDVDRTNSVLRVPKGSVELYRAADGWKDFTNIIAIDDTGIDAVAGRADNAQKVYDIEGRRLQAPRKGLNIVDGRKVMVK